MRCSVDILVALNILMHPRNPYRDKRPDFKALAEKYETFREHVTSDSKGKVCYMSHTVVIFYMISAFFLYFSATLL